MFELFNIILKTLLFSMKVTFSYTFKCTHKKTLWNYIREIFGSTGFILLYFTKSNQFQGVLSKPGTYIKPSHWLLLDRYFIILYEKVERVSDYPLRASQSHVCATFCISLRIEQLIIGNNSI